MAANIQSQDGDIGFQIAPMVDVVFVLLLFFMACAGMQQMETGLKVPLPGNGAGPVAMVITISADGVVSMNDKIFGQPDDHALTGLREWFKSTIETFGANDPLILRPSPAAEHGRIVEVLDAAADAGVTKLSFN